MSDTYTPPKIWTWDQESGGQFANINRPISGATHEKALPVGEHPFQLYSLATPNGVKVTIMLEELLAAGHTGAEYDAWLIRIGDGDNVATAIADIAPGQLLFADEDIRVIAVGDGQQAIDRVTAEPPDIVLADTGMPEHDGYEVATSTWLIFRSCS